MKFILSTLLLLFSTLVFATDEFSADLDVIVFEESKLGKVTFLHKMHSTLDSVKCTTCHHTSMAKGEPEDCHNCHHTKQEKGEEASKSMDAFHTRCQGCHEYTVKSGKTAGPVKKCFLCHEKKKKKKK